MKPLGGCTKTGRSFSGSKTSNESSEYYDRRSILVGSSGAGKSTLMCVLLFYLVFRHKKKVLLYRRLSKIDQQDCLVYMGYENDQVRYFTVQNCYDVKSVKRTYAELCEQYGLSDVWFFLDGFEYSWLLDSLKTFRMLAISDSVDLRVSRE
uniref:Uncharacterized protein n=1 Tax=Globisporangium ultimum (strain ATCC 200006 / CBS 805.95 / DAOM BR144) TaxID=431595 RepID=K3WEE6_GLOUD